jgi:MFS family permease
MSPAVAPGDDADADGDADARVDAAPGNGAPAPLRQRLVVGLATALRFGAGTLMGTALVVYVGARASALLVGLVMASFSLGNMVFGPVWGALADVTGHRRAILVGTGLLATLALAPLLATADVYVAILVRACYAAFAAGFLPVVLAVMSERGGEAGRGTSLGVVTSARSLGWGLANVAVGVLLAVLAPSALFAVVVGVSLLGTVAAAFVTDPDPAADRDATPAAVAAEVRDRLVPAVGNRAHLRTNGLAWLYAALALRHLTVVGVFGLLADYLVHDLAVPEPVMGPLIAVNPLLQMPLMLVMGRVADAAGRKPLLLLGTAGSAVFAVLMATAALPETLPGRIAVVAGGLVLMALSFSALEAGTYAFIGDVAPARRESELMGLSSLVRGLGGVVGPLIIGAAATAVGYRAAFAAAGALAVAGFVLVALRVAESRTDPPGLGSLLPNSGADTGD